MPWGGGHWGPKEQLGMNNEGEGMGVSFLALPKKIIYSNFCSKFCSKLNKKLHNDDNITEHHYYTYMY